MRARLPILLLVLFVAGSAALHAHRAQNPTSSYQSADERSYGKLALNLADDRHYGDSSTQMKDPLHWPPGAPILFAIGHELSPTASSEETKDIPAAYWMQALVSIGTMLAAAGFAGALVGLWGAVVTAALVGFYPPLILQTGEQVSEPLGAFLLTAALCALAWSARKRFLAGYVATGGLLGAAVLTRADLLFVPLFIALLCFAWFWRAGEDKRRGLTIAGLLLLGTVLVMGPWVVYASDRAGKFVPVTRGSASPLFVGTYLPGDGHTVGMKRALEDEVKDFRPSLRDIPAFEIPAENYMAMIAARRPSLTRDAAVRKEAWDNVSEYAVGDPVGWGVMMLDKVQRMWTRYARGGARHTSPWIRGWHIVLVVAAFAGLLFGVFRRRSLLLGVVLVGILYSTALHTLVVSQARYNLPLMPGLIAAGVVGWSLWRRPPEPAQ